MSQKPNLFQPSFWILAGGGKRSMLPDGVSEVAKMTGILGFNNLRQAIRHWIEGTINRPEEPQSVTLNIAVGTPSLLVVLEALFRSQPCHAHINAGSITSVLGIGLDESPVMEY